MPKKEAPLSAIARYLPEGAAELVLDYLERYQVHLTITRERKSILGDYRHAHPGRNHRISVNGNLNRYSFLITLLHELAHLLTFEQHGRRVQAHGQEWKTVYSNILKDFIGKQMFPDDIVAALRQSLHNPAAGSCAEDHLVRALRRYDGEKRPGLKMIEELVSGALFKIEKGRVFRKGDKMRKRYRCVEIATGKLYLFSPVYEVEEINPDKAD